MNEPTEPIRVVQGDLTEQDVDAVVNAANEQLQHGGGVAAAMVRAGGVVVQEESDTWVREHGPLEPGGAAVTGAGDMPAQWIIHVAGPRFSAGRDNETLLRAAVAAALSAAAGAGATSVAMPAISAGIFGYPLTEATNLIADTCRKWVASHPGIFQEIRLVGYQAETAAAFERALE
ncbi:MAG: macro domain-containing protein [Acidimicrobiia bacterium]|nr:macro domain-containing protein [Acidimicrobiia bacterium]